MKANDYQTLAWTTAKPFYKTNVGGNHDAKVQQVTVLTLALNSASGEFSNELKKMVENGENIDVDILAYKLEDVLWYVAGLATMLGIKLEDLQGRNIQKLRERYPGAVASYRQF